jgi:hypothetical protein
MSRFNPGYIGSGPLTDPVISECLVAIHFPSVSFLNAEQSGLMLSADLATPPAELWMKPKHSTAIVTHHPAESLRANCFLDLTSNNLIIGCSGKGWITEAAN